MSFKGVLPRIGLVAFGLLASTALLAHGMSEADKARILGAGFEEFVWLGASHMLSGYDHLLFLLGVVFFLKRFTDILKFITAFTIGHSITLVFATLYGIQANYYLIDAVIALTVCYKGFENLGGFQRIGVRAPSLLWMVFGFGLIHGFGLSTRLQQLPLGDHGLVTKILAFNVGVELGQIIALSVMLFALMLWRKHRSFAPFSRVANGALIIIGGLLLIHQLHGYQHSVYAEDFPISRDDHNHAHEDMRSSALESYPRRLQLAPGSGRAAPDNTPAPSAPPEPTPDDVHDHGDGHFHSH
ncbi:HupE / UreJ protein [Spongiibacter sp. IMCC21906]|jgi:hypothetical protein|uniref:HupE/UreJ family protein n=1 Tax=Spongiibacter sp. IMCC21906 TaxID=1620392 RepID=UPI00062E0968|nr:HupE/UreJ family protein [Spongiibacter sp. IMCC21906]AKH68783.1 HupE / UreJ protein [Spongiibacter sp. IMCC21906]